jgi:hypothetical protein
MRCRRGHDYRFLRGGDECPVCERRRWLVTGLVLSVIAVVLVSWACYVFLLFV